MHAKIIRLISGFITTSAFLIVTTLASAVNAEESFEKEVEYRQGVMNILSYNVKNIGDMLKGNTPWDADKIKTHADDIAAVSKLDIASGFPEDSVTDDSAAMEDIWFDFDVFKEKLEAFQQAATGIKTAAQSGDKAAIGTAMEDLGASCKGCHRKFRN